MPTECPHTSEVPLLRRVLPGLYPEQRTTLLIYLELLTRVRDPEQPSVVASVASLGKAVGASRTSVFTALHRLEELGYVAREKISSSGPNQITVLHYLHDSPAGQATVPRPADHTRSPAAIGPAEHTSTTERTRAAGDMHDARSALGASGEIHTPPTSLPAVSLPPASLPGVSLLDLANRAGGSPDDLSELLTLAGGDHDGLRLALDRVIASRRLPPRPTRKYFLEAVQAEIRNL